MCFCIPDGVIIALKIVFWITMAFGAVGLTINLYHIVCSLGEKK